MVAYKTILNPFTGKLQKVVDTSTIGTTWGAITGTLSDQTDLQTALNLKYNASNPAGYVSSSYVASLPISTFSNDVGYITSSALSSYVPTSRTLTINGTAYDLSADRSWTISGGVTGATNSTLTLTGTTLGLNLGNANTWTGQQTFLTSSLEVGTIASGNNQNINATLGTEKAPALTTGNWTLGTGWAYGTSPNVLNKNADGTGTATPSAATNIVSGVTYKVVITLSSLTTGLASYTLGGATGSLLQSATTYTDYVTAVTTGKLIITPTNTSRFTISSISIIPLTDATGDLNVYGDLIARSNTSFSGIVKVGNGASSGGTLNVKGILRLETENNVASRQFSDIFQAVDPNNSGTNSLFIAPATSGTRVYIGKSGTLATLNLGYVSGIEAMPQLNMVGNKIFWNGTNIYIYRNAATYYIEYGATGSSPTFGEHRFMTEGVESFRITSTDVNSYKKLTSTLTTEQLRVGYDASNYLSTTVGSTGGVTFNAVGSGASFTFSDDVIVPDMKATTYHVGTDAGIDATVTYVDTLLGAKTLTFKKGILTAQV